MIFFSDKKESLSVIDKITKKRIALFGEDGKFETENPKVIKKLKTRFRFESPKVVSNIAAFVKLRKEAAGLGINTKGMKKKDIQKVLKEFESKNKLKGDK